MAVIVIPDLRFPFHGREHFCIEPLDDSILEDSVEKRFIKFERNGILFGGQEIETFAGVGPD